MRKFPDHLNLQKYKTKYFNLKVKNTEGKMDLEV